MALGAQQRDVLRVVVRKGGRLVGLGILLGLSASFVLARFIGSQFWGVSVTDPFTYVAIAFIVVVTGLIACLLPARKASMVEPLVALRYEWRQRLPSHCCRSNWREGFFLAGAHRARSIDPRSLLA
jgi:ABC-type antimicrobial peptide transport system permease subunit